MALVLYKTMMPLPAPFLVQPRRTISLPSAVAETAAGSSGFVGTMASNSFQFVATRTSSKYTTPGVPYPSDAPAASRMPSICVTLPTFRYSASHEPGSVSGTVSVPILYALAWASSVEKSYRMMMT